MIASTSHSSINNPVSLTGFHLAIHFTVKASGIYRSGNQSDVHALLLAMLHDSDPSISRKLHESRARKPWSFSRLFFDTASPVPGSRWMHVREGTGGHLFVNTTSNDVYAAIMEASMARRKCRINDITVELTDIECGQADLGTVKPAREAEIIFHSATFFRDHDDSERMETLDPDKLMRFQCNSLEKDGIATIDRERLSRHVIVVQQNTRRSSGMIHEHDKDVGIGGFSGTAILRCTSPDPSIQRDFSIVMATLPYMGAGSRTSIGFGHCSVRLIDGRR